MLAQMWTHRVMIAGLVRRDLRSRYAGSTLGMAWTVLQPLLLFLVYLFVFSTILQVKFTTEAGARSVCFLSLGRPSAMARFSGRGDEGRDGDYR